MYKVYLMRAFAEHHLWRYHCILQDNKILSWQYFLVLRTENETCTYMGMIGRIIKDNKERRIHYVKSARIGSFSGPHSVQIHENTDQKNSEYGDFSCSGSKCCQSFKIFAKIVNGFFFSKNSILTGFWIRFSYWPVEIKFC